MAGTLPVAGHNAAHYVEVDPVGTQGTFTFFPEVTSSIDYDTSREEAEITPHAAQTDSYVLSPVIKRGDRTIEFTYKWANTVHAAMHAHYHNKIPFGLMTIGPDGALPTSDVVIESGEWKSWKQAAPNRNGEYKVTAIFRPSGTFIKNGTTYLVNT